MKSILSIGILLLVVTLSHAQQSPASEGLIALPEPDWPQWRGPRRDAISAEKGLLPTWPAEGPRLRWKAEKIGRGWSSPIVVGDTVYITGDIDEDLVLHALDHGGNPKWKAVAGRSWKGSFPGARTSAVWSAGLLYLMNAHGVVFAIDAATGQHRWSEDVMQRFDAKVPTWAMSESLLIDGSRLIVTPGGSRGMMAALDKATGETVWSSSPLARATYTSPILFAHGGRRIIANCSSEHGFAVDADTGKLLWTVPLKNPYGVVCSTPVYGQGAVLFVTSDGPGAALYRADDGQPLWKSALDALTGSGILADGLLFAGGCKRTKALHALDWKSGQDRYSLTLAQDRSTYAAVAMVMADGRLYCQAEDGTVAMLKPGAEGAEVRGKFRLVEAKGDAWGHPVLLNGRLYLRYHETLWCFDVAG